MPRKKPKPLTYEDATRIGGTAEPEAVSVTLHRGTWADLIEAARLHVGRRSRGELAPDARPFADADSIKMLDACTAEVSKRLAAAPEAAKHVTVRGSRVAWLRLINFLSVYGKFWCAKMLTEELSRAEFTPPEPDPKEAETVAGEVARLREEGELF